MIKQIKAKRIEESYCTGRAWRLRGAKQQNGINQNGSRSNNHCKQRWRRRHQSQSRSRSSKSPEEGRRGRSRGRERDDPTAAEGSRRQDLTADGCSDAQVNMPNIATSPLTCAPLTPPSGC